MNISNQYPYRYYYEHEVCIRDWRAPTDEWCKNSLQGKYICEMHDWFFELEEDAILFKLTWE